MRLRRAAAVLGLLWATGCPAAPPDDPAAVSEPRSVVLAPDFSLLDLEGQQVELSALRGRVVVIDFWATWCAPCVLQIPVLNDLHERHAEEGVVVLGVSVDVEGEGVVRAFAEEHAVLYTILLGDETLAREFGALGFPSLFVIAPDGSVDSSHVGVIDTETLEEAVLKAGQRSAA